MQYILIDLEPWFSLFALLARCSPTCRYAYGEASLRTTNVEDRTEKFLPDHPQRWQESLRVWVGMGWLLPLEATEETETAEQ